MQLWQRIALGVLIVANVSLLGVVFMLVSKEPTAVPVVAAAQTPRPRATATTFIPTLAPLTITPVPTTLTPSSIPPSFTPPPSPTPSQVFISLAALPRRALIENISGQKQALPLSCESRSAADWAAYYGVMINELEFMGQLPISDNPDEGFVGSPRGEWGSTPPDAYGVHAWPIAQLLRDYGLRANAHRPLAWTKLKTEIAAGRPVIVWVVGHVEPEAGLPMAYTDSQGRTTIVAAKEHTVIVIGYSDDTVTVLDGKNIYRRPVDTFLAAWSVLGNMAITGWK